MTTPEGTCRSIRRLSTFGNRCAQTPSPFGESSTSEDCLYLNVYVPHRKGRSR